jgi:hypothetical protein
MIPKRKATPANRKTRRAQGVKLVTIKRGKPPSGPSPLIAVLKRVIEASDGSVVTTQGLMGGEKGWLFHREGKFKYAILAGKTRVSLHALPMYEQPTINRTYKKLMTNGDFGKGCIRFKPDATVDENLIARFIRDCAKV